MPPSPSVASKRKAPALPANHRLHKRPILRPARPESNTIYISTRAPYGSILKRAHTQLDDKGAPSVTLKASGKAIDMALKIAIHFQEGYVVRLRTGGVSVVDDVVPVDDEVGEVEAEGKEVEMKDEGDDNDGGKEEEEEVTARERRISTVEVVLSRLVPRP